MLDFYFMTRSYILITGLARVDWVVIRFIISHLINFSSPLVFSSQIQNTQYAAYILNSLLSQSRGSNKDGKQMEQELGCEAACQQ